VNRRVVLRLEVAADLLDIHTYIAVDKPSSADRFVAAVRDAFALLARFPGIGSPKHLPGRWRDVRSYATPGFPSYLIFCRPTREAIVVVGVIHAARDIRKILRGRRP